jgi:hypothetical protein
VQGFADIVEAVRRVIQGQHFFEFNIHAQQVTHRVLVLDPIKSPRDHAALGGAPGVRRVRTHANPIGESLDVFLRRSRFRLRRHLTGVYPLEYFPPPVPAGLVGKVHGEPIQMQVALGFLRPVAFQAMLDEKRTNLFVVGFRVRRPGRRLLPRNRRCHKSERTGKEDFCYTHKGILNLAPARLGWDHG